MVVKVDEYARIRHAHATEQLSVRELARRFRHSRREIREILGQPEPKPYQRKPAPSILDPFKPTIDAILKADEQAPRKQRHTAAKIFRRLRDEHGYQGGEERVRLYIRAQERRGVETFIPLDHDPTPASTTARLSYSRATTPVNTPQASPLCRSNSRRQWQGKRATAQDVTWADSGRAMPTRSSRVTRTASYRASRPVVSRPSQGCHYQ